MNIPILGIVENMSYIECPDCKKKISVFGESKIDETSKTFGIDALGQIPIKSDIAALCDAGRVEEIDASEWLGKAIEKVKEVVNA